MHYEVDGTEIRSENAARSTQQPNRHVLEWISSLNPKWTVIDYGCGKLRYTIPLAKAVKVVHAVDSDVQLERVQTVNGVRSSVLKYAEAFLPNVFVHGASSAGWKSRRYDAGLLANVLSAIPVQRVRVSVLRSLAAVLKCDGRLLIANQYANSYFKRYEEAANSVRHLDGWIVRTQRGTSHFYGILDLPQLVPLCKKSGLSVVKQCRHSQSAYVIATTKRKPRNRLGDG